MTWQFSHMHRNISDGKVCQRTRGPNGFRSEVGWSRAENTTYDKHQMSIFSGDSGVRIDMSNEPDDVMQRDGPSVSIRMERLGGFLGPLERECIINVELEINVSILMIMKDHQGANCIERLRGK
ncbi:uncharacterized protein MELLADRAFT_107452 [Melampsora larici-populina 98AG31]|uniref:Uncharacterized protein n=1 Tax=Melampsora larici-populina (strain 98AG31 / pathotype 3-4-7) TaxID=747676 RepID=F4RPV4_MELLP|nr:uncharacterized protein MELLADRAFT_107452 [Melampsora larici-populina 98AG31]EGG05674.1 hypothetical protein MELLADRAFT_107452 [Melampsora larici-populina 98AG31]